MGVHYAHVERLHKTHNIILAMRRYLLYKTFLRFILIYLQVTLSYFLISGTVLVIFDIEIPHQLLTWIIAPIISSILTFRYPADHGCFNRKPFIIFSYLLNLFLILIYTWIEYSKPTIEGDFMAFKGIIFAIYGIGPLIGIVFSAIYQKKVKVNVTYSH